jgi:aspartate ammonia-lyase
MGLKKYSFYHIDPLDHVNKSQSTNDVVPTASRIAIRMLLDQLLKTMESLHASFEKKAREFDNVIKVGRTHLQDAVPIRLGQEFDAYARVLKRDIERIKLTGLDLYKVNMGATAIGTALNTDPIYAKAVIKHLKDVTSAVTGRDFIIERSENLVDATQNSDCFTEVSATLKICMINMSKIANDIRLMVSGPRCGFGEITIPARQQGSSIMPGKINPVMLELVNQVAFQVIGNDQTICLAAEAGQFELNVMQPVLIFNLIQSVSIMNNAFDVLKKYCIDGITVSEQNSERLAHSVEQCAGVATALTPHIGHEDAGKIARESLRQKKSVFEICMQKDIISQLGLGQKFWELLEQDEAKIKAILDPYKMTAGGDVLLKSEINYF